MDPSPDATGAAGRPRVDFYVIEEASALARLRLTCRLAEKAYLAGQRVVVWDRDPQNLRELDELLWTFADRSFVPHELLSGESSADAPVLLSGGPVPEGRIDVLINLDAELPDCIGRVERIAEIVDGDAARRQAGRARFRSYRELGLQPATHNLRAV